MPFVVDASVAACWLLPDERHPVATLARNRLVADFALVPRIWWFEMRNLLLVNERRGRLDPADSDRAIAILRRLPIEFDQQIDESSLLAIARARRLTAYDAAYLEVARREGLPLATLDATLAAAARAEGVALVERERS